SPLFPYTTLFRSECRPDVAEAQAHFPIAQERDRLIAEGRHRGEAAADTDGEEDAGGRRQGAALEREGHDQAHHEAAEDVDGERAEGKLGAVEPLDSAGEPVPADGTEESAERDEERASHGDGRDASRSRGPRSPGPA